MSIKNFNQYITENNEEENYKWIIYHGLGGGFGGAKASEAFEGTQEEAEQEAWNRACEDYQSYEGMYGLRTTSDIMEEDGIEDEEEAEMIYNDERESWLDYWVVPYNEKEIEKAQYKTHFTDF
jgi:hypothetical protein